jgi:hypothetical protein
MALTPTTYTLSALEAELGIDRRTLAKRLSRVAPASTRRGSKRWRLRDVLAALDRDPIGGRSTTSAPVRGDFPLECFRVAYRDDFDGGGEADWPNQQKPQSWSDVLAVFKIEADELRAWIMYGAPYVRAGNARGDGWQFHVGDLIRWSGLFFSLCKSHGIGDESLVEILKARGLW